MPGATLLLLAALVLVASGWAEGVLAALAVKRGEALAWLAAWLVAGFVALPLRVGAVGLSLNLGGTLMPLWLIVRLLWRPGPDDLHWRAGIGALGVGTGLWALRQLAATMSTTGLAWPLTGFGGLWAGVLGYALTRGARAAFVAGTGGTWLLTLAGGAAAAMRGLPGHHWVGAGVALDMVVGGGLVALALAAAAEQLRQFPLHRQR